MNETVAYLVTFGLVVLGYLFVQMFLERPEEDEQEKLRRRRLPLVFKLPAFLTSCFSATVGPTMKRLLPISSIVDLEKKLKMADLRMHVEFVLTTQVVYALLGGMLAFFACAFLLGNFLMAGGAAFLVCLVGWLLPTGQISALAQSRQTAILRALPFAIDLLAAAMRSGLDFSAAVNYFVTTERQNSILAQEFAVMLRDMQLGKTRIEALENVADRVQADEFTNFASAIIYGSEIGAPISDTIKIQGEEMRRRRFARAEEQAAKAPGKMLFPIVMFIMPAFLVMLAVPLYLQFKHSGV